MSWNHLGRDMQQAKARRALVETERVVHNAMVSLDEHLADTKPTKEVNEAPVPRFWVHASPVILACQWCDTNIFESTEDADFADLERAVQEHVCETEREGTA